MARDDGLGDELGDDEPVAPLLPPDDRIWRHPSEVAGNGSSRRTARPARGPLNRGWPMGVAIWLLGGVVGAAVVAAWTGLGGGDRTGGVVAVEQVVAPGVTSPMSAPWETVMSIAERMRKVIVEVRADGPQGPLQGTGVVFRSDGHVLTSHHVVDGASRIVVVLADGRRIDARSLGGDAETDIAVVKVDTPAVPSALMGSASSLRVGQMAMSLGASRAGARPTVSIGTVAAVGRQVEAASGPGLSDMIQTDLPVVATSSGGPLVDAAGAVVGITTDLAGSNPTDGRAGFATPIDAARAVAVQLIASGEVSRPWLGIEGEDVAAGTAATLGVPGGARVKVVRDASPARRSGLRVGDVITALDGDAVRSMNGLKGLLRNHRPGQQVTLAVVGDGGGSPRSVPIRLAERP